MTSKLKAAAQFKMWFFHSFWLLAICHAQTEQKSKLFDPDLTKKGQVSIFRGSERDSWRGCYEWSPYYWFECLRVKKMEAMHAINEEIARGENLRSRGTLSKDAEEAIKELQNRSAELESIVINENEIQRHHDGNSAEHKAIIERENMFRTSFIAVDESLATSSTVFDKEQKRFKDMEADILGSDGGDSNKWTFSGGAARKQKVESEVLKDTITIAEEHEKAEENKAAATAANDKNKFQYTAE